MLIFLCFKTVFLLGKNFDEKSIMIIFITFKRKKYVILIYVQSFANFNFKFFVNSVELLSFTNTVISLVVFI